MKCPCENCLLLPKCKNRHPLKSTNLIISIEKCSLLYEFLKVTKTNAPTTEFWSDLEDKELNKRLKEVDKFIPYKLKGEVW